jgi:DNA polymerase delta subunit 3
MPDAPEVEEEKAQDITADKASTDGAAGNETAVSVQGGRRRGRRKVTKKKTVKDEDGYLGIPLYLAP